MSHKARKARKEWGTIVVGGLRTSFSKTWCPLEAKVKVHDQEVKIDVSKDDGKDELGMDECEFSFDVEDSVPNCKEIETELRNRYGYSCSKCSY